MNRRPLGFVTEIVFWVVGIGLLAFYFSARIDGEVERKQAISAFAQARTIPSPHEPALDSGQSQDDGPAPAPTFPIDSVLQAASRAGRGESREQSSGSDSLPIALLRINRVGLEVPVFADTSERNLNRGAGWVQGTAAPDAGGNMAIAAHRDGYFRVLKDVAVGDILEIESFSRQQTYRVVDLSIVEPEDISPLLATDTAVITLVTCYPFYFVGHAPQRYIVRALAMQ